MKFYKIVCKYRPNTLAVIKGHSPEKAIARYRRLSGDDQPVIAYQTKW